MLSPDICRPFNWLLATVVLVAATTCSRATSTEAPESRAGAGPRLYPLWDAAESGADYAKRVNLPPTMTLDLGNGVTMELVLVPAGAFVMGSLQHEQPAVDKAIVGASGGVLFIMLLALLIRAWRMRERPRFSLAFMLAMTLAAAIGVWGAVRWKEALKHVEDQENEHPAHDVTLTKPFYMSAFVVTQAQYQAVTGVNPSSFKGKNNPVNTVSWDDAQAFCKAVNAKSAAKVRLPTEAEWEFACRAETSSKDVTAPNKFGLYGLYGSVCQWCQDYYEEYTADAVIDPQGPLKVSSQVRVTRGSFSTNPRFTRPASRDRFPQSIGGNGGGFRIVAEPAPKAP